jgi:hypothetical protein
VATEPGAPARLLFASLSAEDAQGLVEANRVANGGFEAGGASTADGWTSYLGGYAVDTAVTFSGSRSLRLHNPSGGGQGAWQNIQLGQTEPHRVHVGAWSRADGVAGQVGSNYSVYIDITYADGTKLFGQTLNFDAGTHDWQYRERSFQAIKPISSLRVYCLLRNTNTGTAWFDGISVAESKANENGLWLDGQPAARVADVEAPSVGGSAFVATGDGLALSLKNGAVETLSLDGNGLTQAQSTSGGIWVRDVQGESGWFHAGGSISATPQGAIQKSNVEPLGLNVTSTYTALDDRIHLHIDVSDTRNEDRAVTVYFALPMLDARAPSPAAQQDAWTWGDDVRGSRTPNFASDIELSNFVTQTGIGATGALSCYPWAGLWNGSHGIALAYPLSSPRIARFAYNPLTRYYFAAFDLGVSASSPTPNHATAELVLYRFDGRWGFRAASQGYMSRFPEAFTSRMPKELHGSWAAFSNLSPISNLADFGITVHETGRFDYAAADDALGVQTFRYLTEPWSNWIALPDPSVDRTDYSQVMEYLNHLWQNGTVAERKAAEATLASGAFDPQALYRYQAYEPDQVPWCTNPQGDDGGCVVFLHNADPSISEPGYPITRAKLMWNEETKAAYQTVQLEGEYLDSFLSRGETLDHRKSHWQVSATPPSFSAAPGHPVGLPLWFGTVAFTRWVAADVHAMNRLMMSNMVGPTVPFGYDLFDYLGIEINWTLSGQIVPAADSWLNYYRTLSGARPFALLMNGDFEVAALNGGVEQYFQVALFHGMWPSFFYSFGANSSFYFDNPAWYNRDRPMFQKYIPLIRQVSTAGWQPITLARSSNPNVFVERYGAPPTTYFTLRNMTDQSVSTTLYLEDEISGQTAGRLVGSGTLPVSSNHTIDVQLPPSGVELLKLQ